MGRIAVQSGRFGAMVAVAIGLLLATRAGAAGTGLPPVGSAPLPSASSSTWGAASVESFDFASLPGRLAEPSLHRLWAEGLELERREALLESAERYEVIVSEVPEEAYTYWRIARNYWRHGEGLPVEAKADRLVYFEKAEDWAARGLSVDADCAPCMLWKFVSMGRQATTKGLLTAVRDVREMDHLIERGIALRPDHTDNAGNATLGNLYYSGAVFYRVIPDWFWLRWFLGVRGDKEKSLSYARKAVSISDMRVDYRVELGAVLLCLGIQKKREAALEEGRLVLEDAQGMSNFLSTDPIDKTHAKVLLDAPEKACGYSRDGFIDMDAVLHESKVRR